MIEIGKYNKLIVSKKKDFGYFLADGIGDGAEEVLLPNNNITDKSVLKPGVEIEAFIYRDSKSRLVATQKRPFAVVGEIKDLKVVSNTDIGSFVDIGLDRDVLVPFRERKYKIFSDEKYPFYIYIDKSGRLCATLDVEAHLEDKSEYNVGDVVSGYVVGFQTNQTAVICVDCKYVAVMLKSEYYIDLKQGDYLENLRVIKKYDDGRIGVTIRASRENELENVEAQIISYMEGNDGFMRFNDKSDPDEIRVVFSTSKKGFKRALGRLMKEGRISQDENGCRLL